MSSFPGPIVMFLALFFLFLFIGILCARTGNGERKEEQRQQPRRAVERSPRVVVSQRVPSVSETFRGARDRWHEAK